MSEFKIAAICKRGHVYSKDISGKPLAERCEECGSQIITKCPSCETDIRGKEEIENVFVATKYKSPDFCFSCGGPFPWVSRQGRIYELQNILDIQGLDEATRLKVSEQLEKLLDPKIEEEEETIIWKFIKNKAPGLIEVARPIIESIVTKAILKSVGLS